jgi:hypothetical protein
MKVVGETKCLKNMGNKKTTKDSMKVNTKMEISKAKANLFGI